METQALAQREERLTSPGVSQTIAVKDTESGIKLVVRKKGAASTAVRPAFATTTIRPRSGGRRAAGVTAKLAKRSYRPDLRVVSVLSCSLLSYLLFRHACSSYSTITLVPSECTT